MAKKTPGNSPEKKIVVTVEDVLLRAKTLPEYAGFKGCNKPAARKRLFEDFVRSASTTLKGFLSSSESDQNAYLKTLIDASLKAPDKHLPTQRKKKAGPSNVAESTRSKVGDVVPASSPVGSTEPNTANSDRSGDDGDGIEWVSDPIYVASVVGQSAEDPLAPLQGINFEGTDFARLNTAQKIELAKIIKEALEKKLVTVEKMNAPVGRQKLKDVVAQVKAKGERKFSDNEKLALATALGLLVVIPTAIGAGVAAYSGAYRGAMNAPTPAVAPIQGVTTADMLRASKEVTSIGGGFTAVRRNGQFELKSEHGNLPIQVTFVSDEGESVVTQGLMPVPGKNRYVFNTSAPQVRVKYRDMSTNEVYETKVVEVE